MLYKSFYIRYMNIVLLKQYLLGTNILLDA